MKTVLLLVLAVIFSPTFAKTAQAAVATNIATSDRIATFDAALLEFFDPSASQLNEPLAYVWSRQLESSISDLRDAQVTRILNSDQVSPAAQALMATPSGSHDLAADAGADKKVQLVIWGMLAHVDTTGVTFAVSLTLPPDAPHWQTFPATSKTRVAGLTIPSVDLDRINLAPITAPLNAIYGHHALVGCSSATPCRADILRLLNAPRPDASGTPLAPGEALDIDILPNTRIPTGQYIPVKRAHTAEAGWVLANILDFLPSEIFISSRAQVFARRGPNVKSHAQRITGPEYLSVLRTKLITAPSSSKQSSTSASNQLQQWYLVILPNGHQAWIAANDARAVWPSRYLNFIAGIYHYALGQFDPAFDEFEAFIHRADENEENVAVSRAYQFMAASVLARTPTTDTHHLNLAIDLLSKAVFLMPFDRQGLALRMYARVGWRTSTLLSASDATLMAADLDRDKELRATSREDPENEDNVNKLVSWLATNNPSVPNSPRLAPIAPRGPMKLFAHSPPIHVHPGPGTPWHSPGIVTASHSHAIVLVSGPNGAKRELRDPELGMQIQYGLGGNRRVVVDNPDRSRTIVEASNRGYVQRPYHYGGEEFGHRTYYEDGNIFTRYYRTYSYHGTQFDLYTPARYYQPSFYGWVNNPWAAPVAYTWDWHDQPWFARVAHYFSPSSIYTGPSSWLTDYLMASSLRDTQSTASAASSPIESAGLTPDVKQIINDEIKQQVRAEAEAIEEPHPTHGVPQLLSDSQSHVFVAGSNLDLIDATGSECALSQGDVVLVPSSSKPTSTSVTAIVVASKDESECKRSTSVTIPLHDLQDMQNHMLATIDAGMAELQLKQRTGALPSAPASATSAPIPAPFAAAGPAPDLGVSREIAEQWQLAKGLEESAIGLTGPQKTPPTISLGQSIKDVRALLGDPTSMFSAGSKIIYIYKDLRITFKDGKVSEVQ